MTYPTLVALGSAGTSGGGGSRVGGGSDGNVGGGSDGGGGGGVATAVST